MSHASQYAYKDDIAAVAFWYMEASAKWMEFDVLGDFRSWKAGIPDYFKVPENGLPSYTELGQMYGTVLFPKYIQERYGRDQVFRVDVVRDSWAEIANPSYSAPYVPYALDKILHDRGSSLSTAFNDFAQANYLKSYPATPPEFVWPSDAVLYLQSEKPYIGNPAFGKEINRPERRIGPLGVHYLAFDDEKLLPQLAKNGAVDGATLNVHFAFDPQMLISLPKVTFYKVFTDTTTAKQISVTPSGEDLWSQDSLRRG